MSDIITFVTGQKKKEEKEEKKEIFRKNDLISRKRNNLRTSSKDLPNVSVFSRRGNWKTV